MDGLLGALLRESAGKARFMMDGLLDVGKAGCPMLNFFEAY
jgi:hypothetical protein